jgi:OPT family oligopeptide transporter
MSNQIELNHIKDNTSGAIFEKDKKYDVNSPPLETIDDREPDDGIPYQLTWRSTIIGSLLGCIVAASNTYLGLKIGWTFGACFFGAIIGYSIVKPMERLPTYLGGGPFGIKENCTIQTAAVASGGLLSGFTTAIPALFRLGILTDVDAIWDMMFLWTLAAAFYGLFFAIPLRKYFIIQQKLVFPSPTATAATIRALHSASSNSENSNFGKNQSKVIVWSFIPSLIFKIGSYFAPFIYDLHPLYWIGNAANSQALIDISTTWGWHLELTTSFIGAGMMMGENTTYSITAGNIFAWAIMSPVLFYYTEGLINKESPWGIGISDDGTISCQMWLMWVGIVTMVCASFTEIFFEYKSIYNGLKGMFIFIYNFCSKFTGGKQLKNESSSYDPVPESEQVPGWIWGSGTIISTIFTILILQFYFSIQWYLGLLAVILGFILSLVATQASGDTDINPISVIGKTSQLVFAPIKQSSLTLTRGTNLIAGNVAATCAAQTVDMISDLKTGHLLRASPKSQFYAQIVGSLFGVVVAVVTFWIFAKAYPCILVNPDETNSCPFSAPSVIGWYGVTVALTSDINQSIPQSCQIACLVLGLITILTVILKRTCLKKYENWIPNMNAFGIALVNPQPFVLLACVYGLIIVKVWEKYKPEQYKNYHIALASGLIAGEGIGGLIQAIFQICKLYPEDVSTSFACPPGGC